MINVVLLGTGNVATHLFNAFSASENIEVKQVFNHSEKSLSVFREKTKVTTSLEDLYDADIYVLALKDDVIPEIASRLESRKGIVVHTSGAVSIEVLKNCKRPGVLYPLQTFSKEVSLKYSEIPFCLEAKYPDDLTKLKKLVTAMSGKAFDISSEQRKKLHLSAVFVCNFVNHLYAIGEEICQKGEIPFEILKPLIYETAKKVEKASPAQVQTGPAIRNDQSTIAAHLELLKENPEQENIYKLLTASIKNFHGKKL